SLLLSCHGMLPHSPCSLLSDCFPPTGTLGSYPLSLHDALPISVRPARIARHHLGRESRGDLCAPSPAGRGRARKDRLETLFQDRSEEHTSELQSHLNLVCRLLLEKQKQK